MLFISLTYCFGCVAALLRLPVMFGTCIALWLHGKLAHYNFACEPMSFGSRGLVFTLPLDSFCSQASFFFLFPTKFAVLYTLSNILMIGR